MPKLFVAIGLPAAATAALERIQPPPSAGIRLAEQNQMHLTLHYLGEADVESIAVALEVLAFQRFSLTLEGVGQFPSSGGAVTLWAGVRENADLLGLRTAVAAALAESGFRPEARRYAPHITLARCEPGGGDRSDGRVPGAASGVPHRRRSSRRLWVVLQHLGRGGPGVSV